jgi:hypothetical protein
MDIARSIGGADRTALGTHAPMSDEHLVDQDLLDPDREDPGTLVVPQAGEILFRRRREAA